MRERGKKYWGEWEGDKVKQRRSEKKRKERKNVSGWIVELKRPNHIPCPLHHRLLCMSKSNLTSVWQQWRVGNVATISIFTWQPNATNNSSTMLQHSMSHTHTHTRSYSWMYVCPAKHSKSNFTTAQNSLPSYVSAQASYIRCIIVGMFANVDEVVDMSALCSPCARTTTHGESDCHASEP